MSSKSAARGAAGPLSPRQDLGPEEGAEVGGEQAGVGGSCTGPSWRGEAWGACPCCPPGCFLHDALQPGGGGRPARSPPTPWENLLYWERILATRTGQRRAWSPRLGPCFHGAPAVLAKPARVGAGSALLWPGRQAPARGTWARPQPRQRGEQRCC